MATLNSSNITNGNTVQPNDLLQLYDALTAGGGYNVSISGSITGSATSASYALSSSYVVSSSYALSSSRAVSSSYALSSSVSISSSYALSSSYSLSSSYALSSSVSISSSYALSSSYTISSSLVTSQQYISSTVPNTVAQGNFKFIAGGGVLNTGAFTSSAYSNLVGKQMGRSLWVNISYIGDPTLITSPQPTLIVNLSSSGAILVEQSAGSDNAEIVWTGMYI